MNTNNFDREPEFQKKIWIIIALAAFTFIVLWILKATFSVLLLVFAGILLANLLQGLAGLARKHLKTSNKWSIAISILFTLMATAGLLWLIGAKIQDQASELIDTIPATIDAAQHQLEQSRFGQFIINKITSDSTISKLEAFGGQFFTSTFGILGDIYVVLFIGLFLAISPKIYIDGIIKLIPEKGQSKAEKVIFNLGSQLKNWLKGKLFSMLVVGILTAIGLATLGIKLWLVLALIAGLISFIPNFGPIIALIPAVLIALLDSPQTAVYVIILYIVVQFLESNFITPLVQQKMISLPPAMILTVQLLMGTLTGGWGLVLATPIAVVVLVLVQDLYLDKKS